MCTDLTDFWSVESVTIRDLPGALSKLRLGGFFYDIRNEESRLLISPPLPGHLESKIYARI
jgi:hypothetical protein